MAPRSPQQLLVTRQAGKRAELAAAERDGASIIYWMLWSHHKEIAPLQKQAELRLI